MHTRAAAGPRPPPAHSAEPGPPSVALAPRTPARARLRLRSVAGGPVGSAAAAARGCRRAGSLGWAVGRPPSVGGSELRLAFLAARDLSRPLGARRSATREGLRRGATMDSAALERDAVQFARLAVQRDQEGRYAEAVFYYKVGRGRGRGPGAGPLWPGAGLRRQPVGGSVAAAEVIPRLDAPEGGGGAGRSAPRTCAHRHRRAGSTRESAASQ